MSSPSAKVLRDGEMRSIPSTDLVPGDIVDIEAGDLVPADCRLLSSASFKCDESALTGESVPVEKDAAVEIPDIAPLGDRLNMAYSGCAVSYGRARALVVETGMHTEMGKIASMLEEEEETVTPLQNRLAHLGKTLGFLALAICAVILVVGLIDRLPVIDMIMTSVSLAVAAIPEGLPAIVTIVLAIGVQRMVAKNAIIRRLPAVETLGSASVICSDKTGTPTQNRMPLPRLFCGGHMIDDLGSPLSEGALALVRLATLCTDGTVQVKDGKEVHIGDPTETAIVACALHQGLDKAELTAEHPRLGEIPFDSDRKLMTVIHLIEGQNIVIVKGAPDVLFERCISGPVEAAAAANEEMGRQALRVLAVAYKTIDEVPMDCRPEDLEQGLTFAGLVGMIDPPRPEAVDAIRECDAAGIRTVMITGDHVVTASAIARQLGILHDDGEAVTGAQLAAMSDEELYENIRRYRVYARVTPADKIRIVKAWQQAGEIVSMTGDGVNDAPALKAADIGCAMGITGTDVAKGRGGHDPDRRQLRHHRHRRQRRAGDLRQYPQSRPVPPLLQPGRDPHGIPGHTAVEGNAAHAGPAALDQSGHRQPACPGARHGAGGKRRHAAASPCQDRKPLRSRYGNPGRAAGYAHRAALLVAYAIGSRFLHPAGDGFFGCLFAAPPPTTTSSSVRPWPLPCWPSPSSSTPSTSAPPTPFSGWVFTPTSIWSGHFSPPFS